MNLALWLVCVVPLFPQNAAPTQQHNGAAAVSDEKSRNARQLAMIDILTDPQGVNFGPYLQRILEDVKEHWHTPESFSLKKGIVVIRLVVGKNGKISKMRFVDRSGDSILDHAAWEGIDASKPFLPLPSDFSGTNLVLRFHFFYNPDKNDLP